MSRKTNISFVRNHLIINFKKLSKNYRFFRLIYFISSFEILFMT